MKKTLSVFFEILVILAVFSLTATVLDNFVQKLDLVEVWITATSITVIIIFLYKRFKNRR